MEGANVLQPQTNMPGGQPVENTRKRGIDKFLAPVLLIIAAITAGAIIYFALHATGVITDGPSSTTVDDPTSDEVNAETLAKKVAIYAKLADDDRTQYPDFENQLTSYLDQTVNSNGEFSVETVYTYLAYANFLIADVRADEALALLEEKFAAAKAVENPGEDVVEAQILYGLALYDYYRTRGDESRQIAAANELLSLIPDDATMHYENWPVIKESIQAAVANLSKGDA